MPRHNTDRNLLFGILALQMDFITRDALIVGMNAWVLEKHRPLGEILTERNALDLAARDALDRMVDLHIARHGNDSAASLAALSSAGGVADELRQEVTDPDILASLNLILMSRTEDSYPTRSTIPPEEPKAVVRFRKLRFYDEGSLGVVWIAFDDELKREVALKEIKEKKADRFPDQAKLLREAQFTGRLEHPGVVPVYSLGRHDNGQPFYAMRFIRGKSLHDAIQRFHIDHSLKSDPGARLLALQELLRRFTDVCNAIAYAHSRGVLHRDLKPKNVRVGKYGETLVVDWGLAKYLGRSGNPEETLDDPDDPLPEAILQPVSIDHLEATRDGSFVGTPGYASPEQATGRLDLLGASSDIYSLGATLYHLIVGHRPLQRVTFGDLPSSIQADESTRPRSLVPWIDPALEAICLKAMEPKPKDRYITARAIAEDIYRWIAGEPVSAYPEPLTRRASRWVRKHRMPLAIGTTSAFVAVLLLCVGIYWQAVQRAKIDASASELLAASERLEIEAQPGDSTRWKKAAIEVQRAVDQLKSGGSPKLLRVASARLEAVQANERVVDALDEARLPGANEKDDHYDFGAKLEAYLAAFQAYGIDIATLSVENAAKRIRASKVADDLISALDDWAGYPSSKIPSERLKSLARAAETDPVRASIREAIAKGDAASLRHRIERHEDREKLGPRLRAVFQALLRLDPVASLPLLETVRGEHSSDFWINHDLGIAYRNAKPQQAQEAVRCLSVAVALRPNSPGALSDLGLALNDQGKLDLAVEALREAIRIQPDHVLAHINLGVTLYAQGKLDLAIESYHKAIQIQPDYALAHFNLGSAMQGQGKLDLAVEAYRKAIQFKPDFAGAHINLGVVLYDQGKFDLAIESYHKAIQIQPDYALAHSNLGNALKAQGKLDLAIESYNKAIQIKSDAAEAHYNLGVALEAQGKLDQAVESYRKAIQFKPDYAGAHNNLGVVLKDQGKLDLAIEAYRKAIQIKPDFAEAHYNLGYALYAQGKLDQAVESLREAIRIKPDDVDAHIGLGNTLNAQGKLDQAVESYRMAIRIKPDALAFCNLGSLLGTMGRFTEALEFLEQGHALGSKQPGWKYPSQERVRQHRRFLDLDTRLPKILKGGAKPTDAAERLDLSDVCYRKGLHAASARFADEAFAEKPALAHNLQTGSRYNAACSASLAGSGLGKDDPMPDEAARAKFREQALGWLRDDLASWAKVLKGGNEPDRKQFVAKTLAHWKEDSDLAGIRDEASLAKLPEREREGFRALWGEVEALRRKAASGDK